MSADKFIKYNLAIPLHLSTCAVSFTFIVYSGNLAQGIVLSHKVEHGFLLCGGNRGQAWFLYGGLVVAQQIWWKIVWIPLGQNCRVADPDEVDKDLDPNLKKETGFNFPENRRKTDRFRIRRINWGWIWSNEIQP